METTDQVDKHLLKQIMDNGPQNT